MNVKTQGSAQEVEETLEYLTFTLGQNVTPWIF